MPFLTKIQLVCFINICNSRLICHKVTQKLRRYTWKWNSIIYYDKGNVVAGEKVDKILFKTMVMASNPKATEAQVTLLWNNYQTTGTLPKGFETLLPSSDNKSAPSCIFKPTGNTDYSVGLERTKPQAPVATATLPALTPKIGDEQSKDLTVEYLSTTVQDAIQTYMSQSDKDGIVSKGWDELKQRWNSEYSSTNVGKVINSEMNGIGFMQKAQNGELSKREYYQENKERLLNMFPGFPAMTQSQQLRLRAKVDSLSMQQIKDMQHEFAMTSPEDSAKLKARTQKFVNEPLPQSSNVEIKSKFIPKMPTPPNPMASEEKISFEEVFYYERGCTFNKENVEKLQENKAQFSFVSGAYQKVEGFKQDAKTVLKDYDAATLPRTTGQYTIPGVEPNAEGYEKKVLDVFKGYYGKEATQQQVQALLAEQKLDVKALQDDKGNVSLQFGEKYKSDADKNAVLNSLLKFETTKQDSKLKQVMGGKTYEDHQKQYAESYVSAMGTKNSAELAKAFAEGQDGVNRTFSGVMTYGGMTLMVVGGVATLVPGGQAVGAGALKVGGDLALAGMATKTVLDVANATTKKGGMTDEDAKNILKEAAINAGGFAIGFGAGAVGSKVGSALISNGMSKIPALVAERGVDATLSMLGDMAMMGDVNLQGNAMNALIATVTGLSKSKPMFKGERAAAIEEGIKVRETKLEQSDVLKDSPIETVNPFAKQKTAPKYEAKVEVEEAKTIKPQATVANTDGFLLADFIENSTKSATPFLKANEIVSSEPLYVDYLSSSHSNIERGHNTINGTVIDFGAFFKENPQLDNPGIKRAVRIVGERISKNTTASHDIEYKISDANKKIIEDYIVKSKNPVEFEDAIRILETQYKNILPDDCKSYLKGLKETSFLKRLKETHPDIENPQAYFEANEMSLEFNKEMPSIVADMKAAKLDKGAAFSSRAKGVQSIYDKITAAIKEDNLSLQKATTKVRDGVGNRTIMADLDLSQHPDLIALYKINPQEAITKACELQSKETFDNLMNLLSQGDSGNIEALKLTNYKGKDGLPYMSDERIVKIKSMAFDKGIKLEIKTGDEAVRGSGYTALQMNFLHKNGITSEWQTRGIRVDEFAEFEHFPYDIRQKKDPTGGRPELKELYEPIIKTVKSMSDADFDEYMQYLNSHYIYLRKLELGFVDTVKPELPVKFDSVLSAEGLKNLHEQAKKLKK